MLSNTINNLINQQITKEFFSAYMYLDIANYFVICWLINVLIVSDNIILSPFY